MGEWMRVNGGGIYGSQAWHKWGEGTVVMPNGKLGPQQVKTPYTAKDIRFTTKDGSVHAWLMSWPEDGKVTIRSLAVGAGGITSVRLLGSPAALAWRQTPDGLMVTLPFEKPCKFAWCLEVEGANLKPAKP
jgi:alpha-L-fucosidase